MPRVSKPVTYGPYWLERRQSGVPSPLGSRSRQSSFFYDNPNATKLYTAPQANGIFCLEFNPEGSLLAAACERRNILLFDSLDPRPVRNVEDAHRDCINGVKFLDSRIFATCSDDYTVALWDLRNLKHRQSQLLAHRNWVKSLDYVQHSRTLVTSGFDGAIFSWNLLETGPSSVEIRPNELFSMNGLMRTRLSPDCEKLIISTTAGYMIVVHNLDLSEIQKDLADFKPNMCRLIQLSQECMMPLSESIDLFRNPGKRNRVEFVCDFPPGNDAEVIQSIQIHPEGHSVLSRNISYKESSEWTCVHTIEENFDEDNPSIRQPWSLPGTVHASLKPSRMIRVLQDATSSDLTCHPTDIWEAMVAIEEARILRAADLEAEELDPELASSTANARPSARRIRMRSLRTGYEENSSYRHLLQIALESETPSTSSRMRRRMRRRTRGGNVVVPLRVFRPIGDEGTSLHRHVIAEVRIQFGIGYDSTDSETSSDDESDEEQDTAASSSHSTGGPAGPSSQSSDRPGPSRVKNFKTPPNDKIHQNIRRLNYFMQEANVSPGYIKEPCFSADGRIICSPYSMGIRLLSFSPDLMLPWQCLPDPPPAQLHCKWKCAFAGPESLDAIVSSRFSPMDSQIAAGSRDGELYLISPFR